MSLDVAVVGAGCVLPDAQDVETFWQNLCDGRDSIREPDPADWLVDPHELLVARRGVPDRTPSLLGGWIGEAPVDPRVDLPEELAGLGRLLAWPAHAGADALREVAAPSPERCGLVLGSYPWAVSGASRKLFRRVHDAALGLPVDGDEPPRALVDALLGGDLAPAVARALGLGGPRYSVDAACAGTLYALKLAALHLRAGDADLMVAGASSAYDPLFTCLGFATLHALPEGTRSRPFDTESDGLAPAEGCVLFALKRLEDARREGDRVLGVIRAVGLSSDGRGTHMLAPSTRGQLAAYERAYAAAGIGPADVRYVECHSTGTRAGDQVELDGIHAFFGADAPLLGSVKSNLGHLLIAAGGAALLKTMLAAERGSIPPTIAVRESRDELVVRAATAWPGGGAAINAFGFGGTNAHLVLTPDGTGEPSAIERGPAAIVGMDGVFGDLRGLDALGRALRSSRAAFRAPRADRLRGLRDDAPDAGYLDDFALDAKRFRLPPADVERLGAQHLLLLETADRAAADAGLTEGSRVAVVVAVAADARAHRLQARWELPWRAPHLASAVDELHPAADVADFLGIIGNLAASRVAQLWDFTGPAFAVSAGDDGALRAVEVARLLLAAGDADAVVVGAVDLAGEPETMLLRGDGYRVGEGAGAVVLRRLEDAEALGDRVYATVGEATGGVELDAAELLGHTHAASGMAALIRGALCVRERYLPGPRPWFSSRPRVASAGGAALSEHASGQPRVALPGIDPPRLLTFTGKTPEQLVAKIAADDAGDDGGPLAVCLVGRSREELREEARAAIDGIAGGRPWHTPRGSVFAPQPLLGELAFVYPGVNAAYPAAGHDLLEVFPWLHDRLAELFADPAAAAAAADLHPDARGLGPAERAEREDELWRSPATLLQIGALYPALTTWGLREALGVEPAHALGYSFGETAMLFGLGAWRPSDAWRERVRHSDVVHTRLGGPRLAVREHWGLREGDALDWGAWVVLGPVEEVAELVRSRDDVFLCNVCAPREVVIAGRDDACRALVRDTGFDAFRAPETLAIHCPPARGERSRIAALLRSPLGSLPDAQVHLASGRTAELDEDDLADAVAEGLCEPVDFPALVERAYAAGARVFVEVGPGTTCTRWIGEILGERPHVAVPTHRRGSNDSETLVRLAAVLTAHRVPVDTAAFAPPSTAAPTLPVTVRLGGPRIAAPELPRVAVPSGAATTDAIAAARRATQAHVALLRSSDELMRALAASLLPAAPAVLDEAAAIEFAEGTAAASLGADFADVDSFPRRVRFPGRPFLAVSRVLEVQAPRGRLGAGRVRTQFDIPDWYALDGQAPFIAHDAQGVLYLLAHMGIDRENRGRRVFRWLDASITFLGELAHAGDIVDYDISIDSFARQDDTIIFFSDSEGSVGGAPRVRIDRCCAGFFTDDVLAAGAGINDGHRRARPRIGAAPPFGECDLEALARGVDPRNPSLRLPIEEMRMIDRLRIDAAGRTIEAEKDLDPDAWYLRAHFCDDPVFAGPLMLEGAFQILQAAALHNGLHANVSGARFEPLLNRPLHVRFRGQVKHEAGPVGYRAEIVELGLEPEPYVVADVDIVSGGRTVGLLEEVGIRLA